MLKVQYINDTELNVASLMKQTTFTLWNLLAFLIRYETVFNLLKWCFAKWQARSVYRHEFNVFCKWIEMDIFLCRSVKSKYTKHTVHSYFISLSKWYHSDKVNMWEWMQLKYYCMIVIYVTLLVYIDPVKKCLIKHFIF